MPNNSQILSNCPACGAALKAVPADGDCQYFICPKHRQFGITGTAIAMMNSNEQYSATLGRRIEEARNSEQELVINSYDL